jgi:hypothetical protein
MNTNPNPLWPDNPEMGQPPSEVELQLLQAVLAVLPWLAAFSICMFVGASLVLATRTKAKGRFLVLAGTTLLVGLALYHWFSPINLQQSLLTNALLRLAGVAGAAVTVFGYARLVWSLVRGRSERAAGA